VKRIGLISTAVLSLILGAAPSASPQEQHDQQDEKKEKPAGQKEMKPQDRPAKQEEKAAKKATPAPEKNAKHQEQAVHQQQQHASQAKPAQQAHHGGGGRIPDDRYRAHFGQEHRFHVTQANYSSRRFEYGGYSFAFVGAWPSNWLYTQDVYVIDMDGVYYLCNAMYPGVSIALDVTL
jgi:hypothetical protein